MIRPMLAGKRFQLYVKRAFFDTNPAFFDWTTIQFDWYHMLHKLTMRPNSGSLLPNPQPLSPKER
ncbi:MAG: hypothetical protein JXB30_00545 [Anaerolineae bacterium]|nr:hypothetical protein [Anaerolineae bacterium]